MKKRTQIGFHRKHEIKEEKKPEKKDDPWGTEFKKDGWEFGKNTAPNFHVPNFGDLYKPINEKKKKD